MLGLFKKNKEVVLKTPFEGEIIDISEVNDPVFSEKMLGDGAAVKPRNSTAVAPCDGKLTQIFPTKHAFGITTKEGLEILVHIGLDTVTLKGEPFKSLVEEGIQVEKGTPIIEVDFHRIKELGKDTITAIVVTNMEKVKSIEKDLNNTEEVLKIGVRNK